MNLRFKLYIDSVWTDYTDGSLISFKGCSVNFTKERLRRIKKAQGNCMIKGSLFDTIYDKKINEPTLLYIPLKIYDNVTLLFEGKLFITKGGTWNVTNKNAKLSFSVNSIYDSINQNIEIERNILNNSVYTLHTSYSSEIWEYEYESSNSDIFAVTDEFNLYLEILEGVIWSYYDRTLNDGIYTYKFRIAVSQMAMSGYTFAYGLEARYNAETGKSGYNYYKTTNNFDTETNDYTRFRKLSDVLDYLVKLATDNAISFDTVNSHADLLKMYVANLSDVKRPTATNPATMQMNSLKFILDYLESLNFSWYLNSSTNKLILKRENAYTSNLNLTGFNVVNIEFSDTDNNVTQEFWDMSDSPNAQFGNITINYGFSADAEEKKEYQFSSINNDIAYLLNNPASVNDIGLCFAVVDNNTDRNILITDGIVNYYFSRTNLITNVLNINRYHAIGDFTTLKNKKLPQFAFKYQGSYLLSEAENISVQLAGVGLTDLVSFTFPLENHQKCLFNTAF